MNNSNYDKFKEVMTSGRYPDNSFYENTRVKEFFNEMSQKLVNHYGGETEVPDFYKQFLEEKKSMEEHLKKDFFNGDVFDSIKNDENFKTFKKQFFRTKNMLAKKVTDFYREVIEVNIFFSDFLKSIDNADLKQSGWENNLSNYIYYFMDYMDRPSLMSVNSRLKSILLYSVILHRFIANMYILYEESVSACLKGVYYDFGKMVIKLNQMQKELEEKRITESNMPKNLQEFCTIGEREGWLEKVNLPDSKYGIGYIVKRSKSMEMVLENALRDIYKKFPPDLIFPNKEDLCKVLLKKGNDPKFYKTDTIRKALDPVLKS